MATRSMFQVWKCQKLLLQSCRTIPCQCSRVQKRSGVKVGTTRCASWTVSEKGIQKSPEEEAVEAVVVDEGDAEEEQRIIEAKRDVSRLPEKMIPYLHHKLHMPERFFEHDFNPERERRFYAYFGSSSNIDPRVAWPTKKELKGMRELESEWEPPLQERWAKLQAEKEAEMAEREAHEAKVGKAMARMPEYIEQFKKRLVKQDLVIEAQEKKRQALMEEARDYFGYNIDPRDPRFKEMQEMKAEEELKLKRKQRKEQKEQKMEAALERIKAETNAFKKSSSQS